MKAWGLWIVTFIVSLFLFFILRDSSEDKNFINAQTYNNFSSSPVSKRNESFKVYELDIANNAELPRFLDDSNVDIKSNEVLQQNSAKSKKNIKSFFDKYNSENDLNNDFISNNGAIYESTLTAVFTGDFSSFITKISTIEKSFEAFENESMISDGIARNLGNKVFEDKLSCAGKLCAITLKYSEDLDKEIFNKIHKSGSFYSFYNYSSDSYGNKQLKLILLSTSDPSKLSISR